MNSTRKPSAKREGNESREGFEPEGQARSAKAKPREDSSPKGERVSAKPERLKTSDAPE